MRRTALSLSLLVATSLSCDGGRVARAPDGPPGAGGSSGGSAPHLVVDVEGCLDLGRVTVGGETSRSVTLRNAGSAPAVVNGAVTGEGFAIATGALRLPAGASAEITVVLRPPGPGSFAGTLELSTPEADTIRVCLRGEGIQGALRVTPESVDLGTHSPEATACARIEVANTGTDFLALEPPELGSLAEAFSLRPDLEGRVIEPGAIAATDLCFRPPEVGRTWHSSLVFRAGPLSAEVDVRASSARARVIATPSAIDLGVVQVGALASASFVLANVGAPEDLAVQAVDVVPAGPVRVELAYGNVGRVDIPVKVLFKSSQVGTVGVEIRFWLRETGATVTVPVRATVVDGPPCTLLAAPPEVRFGYVPADGAHLLPLRIENVGESACWMWGFSVAGDPGFSVRGSPEGALSLPGGETLELEVEYAAAGAADDVQRSELRFARLAERYDDQEAVVVLSALPGKDCIEVSPRRLDFGRVALGVASELSYALHNCGATPLAVRTWDALDGTSDAFRPERPATPLIVPAGGEADLGMTFVPQERGEHHGVIAIGGEWPEPLLLELRGVGF